jgi:two-component system, sensor histidine kinase PdtaS
MSPSNPAIPPTARGTLPLNIDRVWEQECMADVEKLNPEDVLAGILSSGAQDSVKSAGWFGRICAENGQTLTELLSRWFDVLPEEVAGNAELLAAAIDAFQVIAARSDQSTVSTGPLSSPLDRLSALHRISQSAAASLELDSMLNTVVRVVRETVASDACSIFLLDPSSDTLVLRATIGLNPGAIGRATLPLGAGITGEAAVRREVLAITDAVAHPAYVDYPLIGDRPYESQISAPLALRSPDRLIGVLNIITIDRREFDAEELAFIETAASEIAVAIENAQLYSETDAQLHNRISQLSTLRQMSRLVASTLDLSKVLEIVSLQAVELTGGVGAEIYRLASERESTPELVSHHDAGDTVLTDAIHREVAGIVEEVVGLGASVDHQLTTGLEDGLYVLAIPMLTGRRAVGAICVYSHDRLVDDAEFLGMLHAFSDSAAIAIENAELYDQARRGLQRTSALLQEMHHRVRNNLQTVAALLSMQARHATSKDVVVPLNEAVGRIRSIAAIHDVLSSGSIRETTVDVIAKHVTDEASITVIPPNANISFDIAGSDVWVSSREATVLALLINEFVTNSVVHGFTGRDEGRIGIRAWLSDHVTVIEVADDGRGVPRGFDPGATTGLGLQIARTLTESDLNGNLEITPCRDGGTLVRVMFRSRRAGEAGLTGHTADTDNHAGK